MAWTMDTTWDYCNQPAVKNYGTWFVYKHSDSTTKAVFDNIKFTFKASHINVPIKLYSGKYLDHDGTKSDTCPINYAGYPGTVTVQAKLTKTTASGVETQLGSSTYAYTGRNGNNPHGYSTTNEALNWAEAYGGMDGDVPASEPYFKDYTYMDTALLDYSQGAPYFEFKDAFKDGTNVTLNSGDTLKIYVKFNYEYDSGYIDENGFARACCILARPTKYITYPTNPTIVSIAPTTYNVALNSGTGISSVDGAGTYNSGSSVTISAIPSTGYHFKDWTNTSDNSYVWNANPYTFNISGNLNLTANAEANTYTINYIGHNATSGSMQPSHHIYDEPKNLSSNLYKKEHTVTFNYNYTNGPVEEKIVTSTFAGWAENTWSSGIYSDNQSVFNLTSENNGTVDLFTTWTLGSIQLPKPIRAGYVFKSWNTAINGDGTGVGGDYYEPNTDVILYAQWEPIVYSIEYDYAGGTVETENPTTYTIESDTITLNNPTKVGYTFIGWTGSNGDTPQIDVKIDNGSTDDRSYTANWRLDFYAYIKQPDGSWKQAEVYIKQDGTWKKCEVYVKDNNEWLKSVHKDL